MRYDEAIDWLYGTQWFGIRLGLERVSRLLEIAGIDPGLGDTQIVHVAGTNGKGSVCALCESLLRSAGYRSGRFTSPHLVRFEERIQVKGEEIAREAVAEGLSRIRHAVSSWDPHPTFFEITLALAASHFVEQGVDVAVIETGMGGRLDATNALAPTVTVISPIALDHQAWLGDSLAEIAAEKAGILKSGVPLVLAPQEPEAEEVILARAARLGVPVHRIDEQAAAAAANQVAACALDGSHQRSNALVALEAARQVAGDALEPAVVREGLANTSWPGRFQQLEAGAVVLDGAHNPAASKRLVETWRECRGDERPWVIFGAAEGKDIVALLRMLNGIAGGFSYVPIPSSRSVGRQELEAAARDAGGAAANGRWHASLEEALSDARHNGMTALVAGSLFLVGEALSLLGEGESTFPSREQ